MKFLIVSALCLAWHLPFTPVQGERAAQEKAAPQIPDTPRVVVKGEVMNKRLIYRVNPIYPYDAMHHRRAGTVKLHIVIGVDGGVKQVESISGSPEFVQSSINAVRQWKYKPSTVNGQPVEVDTTVEVVFSLNQ
jgi:protein TonB